MEDSFRTFAEGIILHAYHTVYMCTSIHYPNGKEPILTLHKRRNSEFSSAFICEYAWP